MKKILLLIFLFWPFFIGAEANVVFSNLNPKQGETVFVKFLSESLVPDSVTFDKEVISSFVYQNRVVALFGIAPNKNPGVYEFKAKMKNGGVFVKNISVKKKLFPKVVLGIPEDLGLTPDELLSGLSKENSELNKIFEGKTEDVFFQGLFALPLVNNRKISSVFGEIRQTGDQEIRHLGIDLSANLGAVVGAINGGVVRKAYEDPIYGKTVVIDHGQGIFSIYLHLNNIMTRVGSNLKKGQLVGLVGKTGYSTAPHLHLSVKINKISVDPLSFVSIFGKN